MDKILSVKIMQLDSIEHFLLHKEWIKEILMKMWTKNENVLNIKKL